MIKTIIKRDGSKEDFQPSKVNDWATWASEDIRSRVDWNSVVMNAVGKCTTETKSEDLQQMLIKECVQTKLWPENLMAGRLYASLMRKEIFPTGIPTIAKQHDDMVKLGQMIDMGYTPEEYVQVEKLIDHTRDFHMAYFQLKQLRKKYSLTDLVKGVEFETPQFIFMRMAMMLASSYTGEIKMVHIENWYNHFSFARINAPTPNYTNLGTGHNGFASCCLYTSGDDAKSLAIGDHIAYTMSYMSAGIGGYINSRSYGDAVRGGKIVHQGKLPYFESVAKAVKANTQGGRGGACTEYFSIYDPEVETLIMLQNPRTPVDKQNRDIHFAAMFNRTFARKVAREEPIFLFNVKTAPDLHALLFTDKQDEFEALYNKYDQDDTFPKKYLDARKLMLMLYEQRQEVATLYTAMIDEINRHTPFNEPIYSSNLCMEITEVTRPYESMEDLYSPTDCSQVIFSDVDGKISTFKGEDLFATNRGMLSGLMLEVGDYLVAHNIHIGRIISKKYSPEVATCSLGGLVITNIHTEEMYASAAYYALLMIDRCIHMSHYELPNIGYTAKNRINAAVGTLGLAYHLAKKGLKYDTTEGLIEIDKVFERHAYHVISASLKLGQELGNAPWMHKTKWPKGWLPIDTYKRTVDQLVPFELRYDWEDLRSRIIENGGIRNSALIAHPPTESSSKASGPPNNVYPVRDLTLKKSDAKNVLDWCAPDNDLLENDYQLAWNISVVSQIHMYAVVQKWTDQTTSADIYRDRVKNPIVTSDELIEEFLAMVKFGVETAYYQNSFTTKVSALSATNLDRTSPAGLPGEGITDFEGTSFIHEGQGSMTDYGRRATDMIAVVDEEQRGCPGGFCSL